MAATTKIQWADSCANFWSGCTRISEGCRFCYAEVRDARQLQEKKSHWGKGAPRLKSVGAVKQALAMNRRPWICPVCSHAMTEDESKGYRGCPVEQFQESHDPKLDGKPFVPRQFKLEMHAAQHHRRRIFSLSLGDWLDDEVPIEWLAEMLDTIRQCDQVTWILCTKRPDNFKQQLATVATNAHNEKNPKLGCWIEGWMHGDKIPENIILLTSVENQAMADKRIPELLKIPAACRGLSMEPLLSPVDLTPWIGSGGLHSSETQPKISWQIIGGESGPQARPCDARWIRSLIEQGQSAGIAVFVKQFGSNQIHFGPTGEQDFKTKLKDKKGADPFEWPVGFRIQQWPKGF